MPPIPTTGMRTARAASHVMRTAIGLIAGPLRPPVTLAMRGRRVSTSIASDRNVFTSDTASAPAASATCAICAMLVTLGDSFTISGRALSCRQRVTSSSSECGSVPKTMPPCLVFGQLAFSSYKPMPSASFRRSMTAMQSSTVKPKTFAMHTVPRIFRMPGILSRTKASTPTFCRPIALIMPPAVSMMRGARLPSIGSRDSPLVTNAPMRSMARMS